MIITKPTMKFLLSFNNKAEKIQLPIPPPEYKVSVANNNSIININDVGELNMIGKTGLVSISFESCFPATDYYFCQCRPTQKPIAYVRQLLSWKDSGNPMRFAVTGTKINNPFVIENLEYSQNDGTDDINFTLNLKEYRFLEKQELNTESGLNEREDEREEKLEFTFYPGDDVLDVARRAYSKDDYLNQAKTLSKKNWSAGDILYKVNSDSKIDFNNLSSSKLNLNNLLK